MLPGLIDMHLHVYGGYEGWLFPDPHALPYGVTTVVDTGGAGWKNFADFKRSIIDPAKTRVLAFVNIVGAGMTGAPEQDISEMDPIPCAATIKQYREHVVGAKSAHFGGSVEERKSTIQALAKGLEQRCSSLEIERLHGVARFENSKTVKKSQKTVKSQKNC